MQAGNSVRSLATESYNTAAKKFVTRDFEECWELLNPLAQKSAAFVQNGEISPQTRSKLWMLYAALADVATFQIPLSWEVVQKGYDSVAEIDASVMLAVAKVLTKTPSNARKTTQAIEEYLSHKSSLDESDRPLVAFLVLDVLPSLGEFDYAREFADNCSVFDNQTKIKLKSSIDMKHDQVLQAQRQIEQEQIRLQQQEKDRVKRAMEAIPERPAEPEPTAKQLDRPEIRNHPVRARKPLPQLWKEWALTAIKSRGLTNGILFLILLLTLAANMRIRQKVAAGGKWVWAGAKQAIKMGMTVTYF